MRRQPPPRRRLRLDDNVAAEASADRIAADVINRLPGSLSRTVAGLDRAATETAPATVDALADGTSADAGCADLERRYGQDSGAVAYTPRRGAVRSGRRRAVHRGPHVVFGAGRTPQAAARSLPAGPELAHVVQGSQTSSTPSPVHGVRLVAGHAGRGSFARTDKETKPWIERITVEFTGSRTDSDGFTYSTGTATVRYHDNAAKLPGLTLSISGGSPGQLGRSDPGSFTVTRIEGYGYNSGTASGTAGVDFEWSEREKGKNWRYSTKDPVTKERDANMSFAVFYHGGEALHAGSLDDSSHGCVHVDWNNEDLIKQINYHSVVGLTRVMVSYAKKP